MGKEQGGLKTMEQSDPWNSEELDRISGLSQKGLFVDKPAQKLQREDPERYMKEMESRRNKGPEQETHRAEFMREGQAAKARREKLKQEADATAVMDNATVEDVKRRIGGVSEK